MHPLVATKTPGTDVFKSTKSDSKISASCVTIISGAEEVLLPKFGLVSDLVLKFVRYYLFILLIARMTNVCKSA